MKKVFLLCLAASFILHASAQNEKFIAAMKTNIGAMDTAFKNPASFLTLTNNFERIGNAEKNQWLPYYYAALCQVNYGFIMGDMSKLDAIADRAEMYLNKADSLMPKNSEISCIRSLIATERMIVNPMQRYGEYGPKIKLNLEAAKIEDANNPRPYYIEGENLKNTPENFGGGCVAAATFLKTAKEKFLSFKPASDISPNWGEKRTDELIKECNL